MFNEVGTCWTTSAYKIHKFLSSYNEDSKNKYTAVPQVSDHGHSTVTPNFTNLGTYPVHWTLTTIIANYAQN